jgi:CRP-like cAMP-binding protein
LWQFLVLLERKFGRDVEQGRLIDIPVTQQEMAEAINATRVTVTRLLQQFESQGMLLRHSKRLVMTQQQLKR